MRRPPIACRRAVQSLQSPPQQHVWVPDEVPSLAVHRFFPSTCPQQQRHGSNVPGPLEARNRAAKRRMTASAGYYPSDSVPTWFNLGALFGHRSDPQTSWRYEPPSLPRNVPALGSYSPAWDDAPTSTTQPQASAIDPTSTERNLSQAIAQQSAGSADLADQYDSVGTVNEAPSNPSATEHAVLNRSELEQSLDSFKIGFAAAQSASNTKPVRGYFKQLFQQHLPSSPYLWQYCAAVLQYLDSVRASPVPVLRVLLEGEGLILRVPNGLYGLCDCAAFLDSLDLVWENDHATRRKPFVHRILRIMAQLATEAENSTTDAQDHLLLHLIERMAHRVPHTELKTLCGLASKLSETAENKVLLSLLEETSLVQKFVASTIRGPILRDNDLPPAGFAVAVRLLSNMLHQHLLSVVSATTLRLARRAQDHSRGLHVHQRSMKTWLHFIQQMDLKGGLNNKLLDAAIGALGQIPGDHINKVSPLADASKYFVQAMLLRQGIDLLIQYPAESLPLNQILATVLRQLQIQPKAYTAFLDAALPLVARHAGPIACLQCLRTMVDESLPLSTKADLSSVIKHVLAELKLPAASLTSTQALEPASILRFSKRLDEVLRRTGHTLPATTEVRQFGNVLENARTNHALPIDRLNTAVDSTLMERVALVHQLAHHYSLDTTLTQRQAWRQIYYLYTYLDSNSLPIGPLFTKAVAHAAITRPLQENRFVSARRLIWVCRLVARVEGNAIATQVETDFYRERGEIIRRAKKAYIGVGGSRHDKANIGSTKRLGMI